MSTNAWLVFAFGLAALVFGGIGAGLLMSQRDFRRIARKVPGQVVRLRPSRTENGVVYYPTIRFTTVNGQRVEAETGFGTNPPMARLGAEVGVLYDPERPSRFRVDSLVGGGTLVGAIFAGVGAVMLGVCVAVAVTGGF
ncbi:DUF3592 domain-containing protein [Sphaerisporangium corydalis]|uniref:DUF3592 domain-containing protein n=1 Tax=Sphaerisporangium corydalis TaxID=1441875 RepID=A0ABV9EED2_9ACTN|nr:DUF3592 domain-containing protein [Sphaerisporangium corydalis]